MKLIYLLLFAAVIIVIAGLSYAYDAGYFINKKTYSGPDFEFQYPSSWAMGTKETFIDTNATKTIAMVYDPKNNYNFVVISLDTPQNATPGPGQNQTYRIISDRYFSLNGYLAREVIYVNLDDKNFLTKSRDIAITVERGKRYYVIHCSAMYSDFELVNPYFNVIINSFSFKALPINSTTTTNNTTANASV